MAKDLTALRQQADTIRNEKTKNANTAERIGGMFADMLDYMDENSSGGNYKGYFQNATLLNEKYPNPANGDYAWVGEPYPGNVYDVVDGKWHDTGEKAEDGLDPSEFATKEELAAVEGKIPVVDSSLSSTSANPVQNKVIAAELESVGDDIQNANSNISSLQVKVNALSGVESNFIGYYADSGSLPSVSLPCWALVGDLGTAKPYAYYTGTVPSGFSEGWNDLSGKLGTYDFTALDGYVSKKELVYLVGFGNGTVSAGVTKNGDIYYNTQNNVLRKCVNYNISTPGSSSYENVDFSSDAIYKCNNELYYYDGEKLVMYDEGIKALYMSEHVEINVSATYKDGYVDTLGAVVSSSISHYSSPIPLKKGYSIVVGAYAKGVSVISLTDAAGSYRAPVVKEENTYTDDYIYSKYYKYYSYTATEDCYVCVTGRKTRFQCWVFEKIQDVTQAKAETAIPAFTREQFVSGYYNLSENTPVYGASDTTLCLSFPVNQGDTIVYDGAKYGSGSRIYAITDSSGQIILRAEAIESLQNAAPPYIIKVPEGGERIYLNLHGEETAQTKGNVYYAAKSVNYADWLNQSFDLLLDKNDLVSGYYPIGDEYVGELTGSTGQMCCCTEVNPGDGLILLGKARGQNSRTYAIADSTGKILIRSEVVNEVDNIPLLVTVPDNGVMLYCNNSIMNLQTGLKQDNFYVARSILPSLIGAGSGNAATASLKLITRPVINPWNSTEKRTYSLCWIKSFKKDNSLPFNVGFYFSDYPAKNGKLYYSNCLLGELEEVCDFSKTNTGFDSETYIESRVVAVSPKHNSVITNVFDRYPGFGLRIYEDGKYAEVNFDEPMQAWLYNCGIEFVTDSDGTEYCIFGEYSHARKDTRRVFKGHYPYSVKESWKVVLEIPSAEGAEDGILHIHHIHKDPWSKYMYCCCGDTAAESRWFYSSDLGDNWTLLASNFPQGYLRCCNVIFTESDVWWASDDTQHFLLHATRDSSGLVDVDSIETVCSLPSLQATNSLAYIQQMNALFFYDRVYDPNDDLLQLYMYDISSKKLIKLATFDKVDDTYYGSWGNRGKCYNHYPNSHEPRLAMGIVDEYNPCIFDIPGNDKATFGTIMYEI